MFLKKLFAGTALLTAVLVSGCNLSTQAAAQEVAINLATLEVSPTATLALTPLPTRTPIDGAAPTLIALGGTAVIPQPASLNLSGTIIPPTQPPPQGICSAKPTGSFDVNIRMGAGTNFDIITALHAGQYVQVVSRSDVGWLHVNMDGNQGWVSGKVVTLFGPCNGLPVEAVATMPASPNAPGMTPTPTAMFGFTMNIPLNQLITKETVGNIPAGTTVMVTSTQFNGSFYLYGIITADGRSAMATDSQLAYSAGGGSMPFPTPTPYVYVPTSTATVPVMDLPTDASPSDVVIPDGLCTVTAKSKTTLYASPNISASVVGGLNPGPWAQVGATNGQGWYKVTIWTDGRQGWGNISTLTLHGPCDSLPTEGG